MENDFLSALGYLGLTARIKRLSDSLSGSIRELYQSEQVDLEPSWHLVILVLKDREKVNMRELAESLKLSQPAVTKMIGKMKQRGIVKVSAGKVDQRQKHVSLSAKTQKLLPQYEQIWEAGRRAIEEMLGRNAAFMESLADFEARHIEKDFKNRAKEQLEASRNASKC